jgi:hypothetical protein
MAYGTIATLDSLRSNFQTIAEFGGVARIQDSLQVFFESHNNRMREFMADFMDRTVERDMIYGTNDTMKMVRTDEFGRPDPQKITYGAVVGFPLHSYQASIQWTEKSVETLPVAEFTAQYLALRAADIERVTREAQRALFNPTNYVFTDYLMDRRSQVPIQVRALANADGNPLPVGPNGDAFPAATHTHYLATAAFVVGDLTATVETVVEHYNTGSPFVYINRAQETVRRLPVPRRRPLRHTHLPRSPDRPHPTDQPLHRRLQRRRGLGQALGPRRLRHRLHARRQQAPHDAHPQRRLRRLPHGRA